VNLRRIREIYWNIDPGSTRHASKIAIWLLISAPFLTVCFCCVILPLFNDYGWKLHKPDDWSTFTTLGDEDEIRAKLDKDLTIGQSTPDDVRSYLQSQGVQTNHYWEEQQTVRYWTPFHGRILTGPNPRGYYLICSEWNIVLTFHFQEDVLSEIEVAIAGTCL
jgi:hypothetical protein